MHKLKFNKKVCAICFSADCILNCHYTAFIGLKEARGVLHLL